MNDRELLKTLSWSFVSFWIIWPLEVAAHWYLYGREGLEQFARASAFGTAVACVGKAIPYAIHDLVWDRWLWPYREGPAAAPEACCADAAE